MSLENGDRVLLRLGLDELTHVLSYVSGKSIVALFCVGNIELCRKMSVGAVREVRLTSRSAVRSPRIPSCLFGFHRLQKLVILRKSSLIDDVYSIRRALKRLPPSLEALELHLPKGQAALLEDQTECLDGLFKQDINDTSCELDSRPRNGRLWDLSSHFPNLKTLIFGYDESSLMDCDIAHLPQTLTRLSLPYNSLATDAALPLLPPGLLDLRLGQIRVFSNFPLPPNLLRFRNPIDPDSNPDTYQLLPKTLESLYLLGSVDIPSLPTSLLDLQVSDAKHDYPWHLLPQLTSLKLSIRDSGELQTDFIASIPRTLKVLDLNGRVDLRNIRPNQHFPPTLTNFSIRGKLKLDIALIRALPATLEEFSILNDIENSDCPNWIAWLPRSLRVLVCPVPRISVHHFPPQLSRCIMFCNEEIMSPDIDLGAIEPLLLDFQTNRSLPSSDPTSVDPPPLTGLKPSFAMLSYLTLTLKGGITRHTIELFPRTLILLHLPYCESLSPDSFHCMPPNLTSLIVWSLNAPIESENIAHLPRSLTKLELPSVPLYPPPYRYNNQLMPTELQEKLTAIIKALPRDLRSFRSNEALRMRQIDIIPLIKQLPPRLKYLLTGKWEMNAAIATFLPRRIVSLLVTLVHPEFSSVADIAKALISALPPTIDPTQSSSFCNSASDSDSVTAEIYRNAALQAKH